MSDETTTWLKRNSIIHPFRRSLKTSLRFHVNNAEMDASMMSNPDNGKDQNLFIPTMLKRPAMRIKKLRENEFKLPAKPLFISDSNQTSTSEVKAEGSANASLKKSFLPVPKSKLESTEKKISSCNIVRQSFLPRNSARKNTTRRELIIKMVEASKQNKVDGKSESKIVDGATVDNSILRSILKKKRTSLRKSFQSKPKGAKKVLFEGFGDTSTDDKENEVDISLLKNTTNCETLPVDEPTVFLNFPDSDNLKITPLQNVADSDTAEWSHDASERDLSYLFKKWKDSFESINNLQSARNCLTNSFQALLEQSKLFQDQFASYVKNSQEIWNEFLSIGKKLEDNLKKTSELKGKRSSTPKKRNSGDRKFHEKEKIKLSDKSKVIKKSSCSRKSNQVLRDPKSWKENGHCFSLTD